MYKPTFKDRFDEFVLYWPLWLLLGFFVWAVYWMIFIEPEHEAARHKAWVENCTGTSFTQPQCEVLYSIKKSSDDAAASAAFAVGIAAGSGGSRR